MIQYLEMKMELKCNYLLCQIVYIINQVVLRYQVFFERLLNCMNQIRNLFKNWYRRRLN